MRWIIQGNSRISIEIQREASNDRTIAILMITPITMSNNNTFPMLFATISIMDSVTTKTNKWLGYIGKEFEKNDKMIFYLSLAFFLGL